MTICPLAIANWLELSPGMWLFWPIASPDRKPLNESFPRGPASNVAGGRFDSGPVNDGVDSGIGAAGAAGAAAGAACASCGAGAGVSAGFAVSGFAAQADTARAIMQSGSFMVK